MTLIDEEVLRDALRDAATECEVSDLAKATILEIADVEEAAPRRRFVPDAVREPGRARTLLAVAAVLVLVTAIAVPLLRGESPSPANRSATPTTVHGGVAFTVTPSAPSEGALAPSPEKALSGTGLAVSTSQKIESTGTVDLTVARGRVESTFTKLTALATQLRGLVSSTEANSHNRSSGSFASGTIVLQVPEPSFARFVAEVEHVGRATSVITSSNDVTGQYVDLQARIAALDASLAQYLKIMTRATTISGILAVQNQINTIQTEIEQDQGQLKVLANETTYASLTVNVTEAEQHHASTKRSGFGAAWHDSLNGFVAGFEWLVRLAGPAFFGLLMLGALYEIVKYGRRAIRRRRI
jgi:hypothetical protein